MVITKTAFVKIWGETIGAVSWNDERGYASFEYDPEFVRLGWGLSPIMMPLDSDGRIFSFPELKLNPLSEIDTFKGLPGLLADVLPDRYGNQLINSWLAQNGRAPYSMNPVEQLCFIGTRGMGALEFEPSYDKPTKRTFEVEINALVEISSKMLDKREKFETNIEEDEHKAMMDILKIGTSAGGARPKAIIAYNEKTGVVKSGQTIAPKGFEHWIIKLDGVSDSQFGESKGYGRVEMAYYKLAIDCGINIMQSRLLEENGRSHFITKRFDREDGNVKFHVQTFCAMRHFDFNNISSYSYEQLFQTMRMLHLPYPQAEQMYRRMVFNVLAKNCDDHTKNFAFRLKQEGEWELAPAYDLCHAYRPNSNWVSQHCLSISGKRKGITRDDLLTFAKSMNIKKPDRILIQISETISNWNDYADETGVNSALRDSIKNTFVKIYP